MMECKSQGLVSSDGYSLMTPTPSIDEDVIERRRLSTPTQRASVGDIRSAHQLNRRKVDNENFNLISLHIGTTMERPSTSFYRQSTPSKLTSSNRKAPLANSKFAGPGAVSEDDFNITMSQIKTFDVPNTKESIKELTTIRNTLANNTMQWTKKLQALSTLRGMFAGGLANHNDFNAEYKPLCIALSTAIADLRSQTCREACITVAYICQTLGIKAEMLCELLLDKIINLIQNSAKVMASSGYVLMCFVVRYVHSTKLLTLLLSFKDHKAIPIRQAIYILLATIIATWTSQLVERNIQIILDSLRVGLQDADSETRANTRKAFHVLQSSYPSAAESLSTTLDPKTKRLLMDPLSAASSTQSINSVGLQRKKSQENITLRTPSTASSKYGLHSKLYLSSRSRSDVDAGAAFNARIQRPPIWTKPQVPQQAQSNNSLPGSRSNSPTSSASSSRKGVNGNASIRTSANQQRTPASAKGVKRFGYNEGRRFSNEAATPSMPRIGITNSQRLGLDAQRVSGKGSRYTLDDFDDADTVGDTASVSEINIPQTIAQCTAANINDCRKRLRDLKDAFKSGRALESAEITLLCEKFTSLLDEANTAQKLTPVLETLQMYLMNYDRQIYNCKLFANWLPQLLQKLVHRSANDSSPASQALLSKCLDILGEQYPSDAQVVTISRHLKSTSNTPVRMRLLYLKHIKNLLARNVHECRSKIDIQSLLPSVLHMLTAPTSLPEIKKASREVIIALFEADPVAMSSAISSLNTPNREVVQHILQSHQAPSRHELHLDLDNFQDHLLHTTNAINAYCNNENRAPQRSLDSGIVDSANPYDGLNQYAQHPTHSQRGDISKNFSAMRISDYELKQADIIAGIKNELLNYGTRIEERKEALHTLRRMVRDGTFTLWDEHFKEIFGIISETLNNDNEPWELRALVLNSLKEICTQQATRFRDYAELTILMILKSACSENGNVKSAAESFADVVATHLPPHTCLHTLNPIIKTGLSGDSEKLNVALKMTTGVIRQLTREETESIVQKVLPNILSVMSHSDSRVRKSAVMAVVEFHQIVGEAALEPLISKLEKDKRRIIQMYINKKLKESTNTINDSSSNIANSDVSSGLNQ